jgi:CheY-like chemotaxis protein
MTGTDVPGRSWRVLFADDDPLSRLLTGRLLEQQGHRVVLASDGHEAVMRAGLEGFDVLLLDIHMPGMNGLETSRALRQGGMTGPIIGLTGDQALAAGEEWKQAGMDACLHKPFRLDQFNRALRLS